MRKFHVSVLTDCYHKFDQQLLARCSEIPALASRLQSGSLVIGGNEIQKEANIILGDPAFILSALKESDSVNTESVNPPLSRLMWVQSTYAGVNMVVQNHSRDNYVLTRTCGFGPQMAEYCMGWILFRQQKIALAQQQQAIKGWDSEIFTYRGSLQDKTLGILGVGDIGSTVASAARAFEMRTLGLCSSEASAAANTDRNFNEVTASLMDILVESDILVNTLPSTPRTTHMLTHSLFQEASRARGDRPPPLFINIGRGDIITTSDLLASLNEEESSEVASQQPSPKSCLSYAVLDVVEEEPLPSSSPLWTHPNVSITPHISAISTPELVIGVFTENLIKFLDIQEGLAEGDEIDKGLDAVRQSLNYVVDRSKGY